MRERWLGRMRFPGELWSWIRWEVVLAVALVMLTATSPNAIATDHPCKYTQIAVGKPVEGSTVSLIEIDNDDRRFKLDGMLVPGNKVAVISPEALSFHTANDESDRYRRIGVQAFTADGGWLQGRLLEDGRVFQFALGQNPGCITAMRLAERGARKARTGLWADDPPVFEANNTDALLQQAGKFAIIKGTVRSVGDRKRRLYLNFGSNWSEDVTAVVVKTGSGAYRGDVAMLQQLEGKRVEIRGIVEDAQGPLIRLIDEAQIDILDR